MVRSFSMRYLTCGLAFFLLLSYAAISSADIYFYKVNKRGQQSTLSFVRNADEPGCHNLFTTSDLHRVAQSGFEYCEIFEEKDCQGEPLAAQWMAKRIKSEEKKVPATKLTKGTRWVFNPEGNIDARSWRCVETTTD